MIDLNFEELGFEFQTTSISLTQMAEREGVSRQTLSRHFKKLGIEVINKWNYTKFNDRIFDCIDSEEKAYWLGFIYADGCISSHKDGQKNKNTLEISLKASDVEHLRKFAKFIEHTKNIVNISDTKCGDKICKRCRISVTNKHLWETLNNYGCTPQKSLTLKFPNEEIFSNIDLIKHFIRGYFDGDGCLSRHINRIIVSPVVQILGTPEFLNALLDYIPFQDVNIHQEKQHSEQTLTLSFRKNDAIGFINYIYEGANIYLDRKYKLYEFFKNGSRSVEEFTEFTSGNIGENPEMDNPEISSEIKESEPSYSVETEPNI